MPEFELIEGDPKGTSFGPLNRINIFVGANNSGKSRLMRRLMSKSSMVLSSGLDNKILENINEFANISNSSGLESVVIKSRNLDPNHSILRKSVELAEGLKGFPLFQYGGNLNLEFKKIASAIKNLQENYLHLFDFENWTRREQPYILGNKGGKPIAPDLFCDVNGRISLLLFEGFAIHEHTPLILRIPTFIDKAIELLIELLSPTIKDFVLKNHLTNFTLVGIDSVSLDALVEMSKLWKEVLASDPVNIERVKKRYIPVLRSAQRLWNKLPDENVKEETTRLLSEDNPHPSLFQITVKKHYSELLDSRIDVFNGQELFHKIIEARNGGSVSRSNFEDFESFEDNRVSDFENLDFQREDSFASHESRAERSAERHHYSGEPATHIETSSQFQNEARKIAADTGITIVFNSPPSPEADPIFPERVRVDTESQAVN